MFFIFFSNCERNVTTIIYFKNVSVYVFSIVCPSYSILKNAFSCYRNTGLDRCTAGGNASRPGSVHIG